MLFQSSAHERVWQVNKPFNIGKALVDLYYGKGSNHNKLLLFNDIKSVILATDEIRMKLSLIQYNQDEDDIVSVMVLVNTL